jgi:Bacterial Ig domain
MNQRTILLFGSLLALTACPGSGSTELTVGLTSPSGTAYTNGTLNVQATVTGGTVDSLELLRNGDTLATLSAPYTYVWDTSALPEGGYSLGVRAMKGGKSVQGEARTVFVDRTVPTISLSSSTATLTTAGSLELSANVNDSRGVALVEFFDDDQKVGEATSSPYKLSLNLSSSDNREHNYRAKAIDRAGNRANSTALKVAVLIPKRTSENLIVNGDAEAGPASAVGDAVDVPGWPNPPSGYKRFTVIPYGASGFPSIAEAPANSGNNFFAGGFASSFNGSIQTITLPSDWLTDIDAGNVSFDLGGEYGGKGSEDDNAGISASFLDAGNFLIMSVGFKTVKSVDRGGTTGFVRRASTDALPKQARSVRISLEMNRTSAIGTFNDGYADNLSLVLKSY